MQERKSLLLQLGPLIGVILIVVTLYAAVQYFQSGVEAIKQTERTQTPIAVANSEPTSVESPSPTTAPITPIIDANAAASMQATPTAHPQVVSLLAVRGDYFSTSGVCASCHANLQDESGADISFDRMWRSTMMANAGHDPYWRAGLRREVLANPDFSDYIQDKCATCHMPMARTTVNLDTGGDYAVVFGDQGIASPSHPAYALAMDGVSCTQCHQIQDVNLGTRDGFSGHYTVDATADSNNRVAYGPFAPIDSQVALMQASTGFVQTEGSHIQRSEFCATCHELYTPYFDAETRQIAENEFPEQTPYGEWLHSDYRETQSCQNCHMPLANGLAPVASVGNPMPEPRANVSQHLFVGGNAYMLRIFQQFGEELGVTATSEQFQDTIDATRAQLQQRTATLTVEDAALTDGVLKMDVAVQSQVGHKLPASYPSRRAWLHVTVRDAAGNTLFESGDYRADGMILENDNDLDPARYEPHYDVITSPDQVQIYEPILGNTKGEPTTTLLLAAQYLKDNRLLPTGFDKTTAPPEIAVHGDALTDDDFVGGSDRVTYQVAVGEAKGPFTVEAELVYQTIGFRWIENLREYEGNDNAPEIDAFLRYAAEVPNTPEPIASITVTVE